jgi:PAS domain S-box-containing protein
MTGPPSASDIIATVAEDLPVGVWVARAPGGEFVYANRAFVEIMGMAARTDVAVGEYAAPYGIHSRDGSLYPEHSLPFVRALRERAMVVVDDIVIHRHDGRKVYIRAQARPLFDGTSGELTHVAIAFIDITCEVEHSEARAASEARLAAAQRMESVGTLAGGIAHDFNNLLATIEMLSFRLQRDETDPARLAEYAMIQEATRSAADLTRALLGVARRGKHLAAPVSLDQVVRNISELISRTFDKRIELCIETGAGGDVLGDYSQLEQVLMNLLVNARDAMPDGGRLVVRSYDAVPPAGEPRVTPQDGPHVVLEVSDTGVGIDPSVRHRIFEPYFTTKTGGAVRGTGLGLATVYGIVDAHHGAIEVLDNPPRGTLMRVWLPSVPAVVRPAPRARGERQVQTGSGTVLVVDDEPLVRRAFARALETLGYDVLLAADGVEAVDLYRERTGAIAAVVLDMVMPRMDGRATYLALRELDPSVSVLLTTGFALNEEAQSILDLGVRAFVPKPCDIETLSHTLARVIARGA